MNEFIVYDNDNNDENQIRKQFIKWDNQDDKVIQNSPNQFIQYMPMPQNWGYVDNWVPLPQDNIFRSIDKAIILPVSLYYGYSQSTDLDYFIISPKRCYTNLR